jgi:hypothetical protein
MFSPRLKTRPRKKPAIIQNMLRLSNEFTPLERSVLSAIHEEHPNDRDALAIQLSVAKVRSRENTGAGFFTYFDVPPAGISLIAGPRLREGPGAKIKGLQHGMGFILWIKGGVVDSLEGFAYADSTTDVDWQSLSFELDPTLKG